MKKLVLILAILALNLSAAGAVKMASGVTRSHELVADTTNNKMVDGLHIALPNNLKYFPAEQLVPLP